MGPFLDVHGLKHGRRLLRLSDEARLYYPLILGSANGYGRLEMDYQTLWREIFSAFKTPLPEVRFWEMVQEYRDADLVFLYEYYGQIWAQFDTKHNSLPNHKSKEDLRSPAPPHLEYSTWRERLRVEAASSSASKPIRDIPKCADDSQKGSNDAERDDERREEIQLTGPANGAEPFEESWEVIVGLFPASKRGVFQKIVEKARSKVKDITDRELAIVLSETHKADQKHAGLWLQTVSQHCERIIAKVRNRKANDSTPAKAICQRCGGRGEAPAFDSAPGESLGNWANRLLGLPLRDRYQPCPDCQSARRPEITTQRIGPQSVRGAA